LFSEQSERHKSSNCVAAKTALLQLLQPLADFVLDSGLSIQEVNSILREAVVRSVAAQQLEFARRVNISGIAASTGIPRGEISRILKSKSNYSSQVANRRQQATNKVLAAWRRSRKFRTPNGQPSELRIYGRGATFDSLVRSHGHGIPTRAMLDELVRTNAIEVRPFQVVRLSSFLGPDRGLTPQLIKVFGDRVSELFSTILQNKSHPHASIYVGSVSGNQISPNVIHMLREELSIKGRNFLVDIRDTLNRGPEKILTAGDTHKAGQISVTIFFHHAPVKSKLKRQSSTARRNFRRAR
jgi:hypothetical protein